MRTKFRIATAIASDTFFLTSMALGAVALLLEDGSAALRALALHDLPPAVVQHAEPLERVYVGPEPEEGTTLEAAMAEVLVQGLEEVADDEGFELLVDRNLIVGQIELILAGVLA